MNPILELLHKRKSVRAFENKEIPEAVKDEILKAALRSPTAGNMMLYTVLEITEQKIKDTLVKTCDNQPFIATSPFVLLFLADYQRWFDYFIRSGVPELCREKNIPMRKPEEGDFLLACCDAMIAAQTAVVAAESLGIGSCYIGDIMENYEVHKELFDLPEYVFPIGMICFGYPTCQQMERKQPPRFAREFIVFKNKYKRLTPQDFDEMYKTDRERVFRNGNEQDAKNIGQHYYIKKFDSAFSKEMSRSVREALKSWQNGQK